MRVVLLLLVLAVIGLTLAKLLGGKPPAPATPREASDRALPAVPTRPQDLKGFERDMNRFIQDAATERANREEK
ncbi:MAG: hypothetical protein RKO24_03800 [Candidatus Competibacter sp.]|nr:hypothetical protein [Candidatus Competibacter sp.]